MAIPWPPDPDDIPPGEPQPNALPGLGQFLRRRYTSNVAIIEQMSALDLLNEVIFPSCRGYLVPGSQGKLGFKIKRPVPWGLGTSTFSSGNSVLNLDNVKDWVGNSGELAVIAPHSTSSEVKETVSAAYSLSQNSTTLTSTGGLFSITGFSGCDGASTPATAQIQVTANTANTTCTIVLAGIEFTFKTSAADTKATIASYITGIIASHPALYRRFTVVFNGVDTVTLTARAGTLTLNGALSFTTPAPIADPTTAPTLTETASGTIPAGNYAVAYSFTTDAGETLISKYSEITLGTSTKKITVSAITPPAGVIAVNWYCSPEASSKNLRRVKVNLGASFVIDTLPKLTDQLTPDINRTGCEVIKVSAVFTDRTDTRTSVSRSNVLKASYSWLLGNREKSINRIDLKYRNADDDWRLVTLRVRDEPHITKVKKVMSEEVNGQAIDNTDQAYRIAVGLLAEKRDADFFYKWRSTRESLLLEEGDVVALTDHDAGLYNFPVIIEEISFDLANASLPTAQFTGRKYATTLYDDSIADITIPTASEL